MFFEKKKVSVPPCRRKLAKFAKKWLKMTKIALFDAPQSADIIEIWILIFFHKHWPGGGHISQILARVAFWGAKNGKKRRNIKKKSKIPR